MKTVIIGAGQAAIQTILSLRQGGYDGAITLIGMKLTCLISAHPSLKNL